MINQLKNDLQLIHKINHEQQRRTLTEALRQTSNESKASKIKVNKYYDDIFQCKKKIFDDRKQNRENETQLRKVRSHSVVISALEKGLPLTLDIFQQIFRFAETSVEKTFFHRTHDISRLHFFHF